jgi:TrmH family RNA methyltransferase
MITSQRNPKIQYVRSLIARARRRREAQAFIVEGVRLAEEALAANRVPELVLFTAALGSRGLDLVRQFEADGAEVLETADHVLQAISDTRTSQGILVVLPILPPDLPPTLDFILIVDNVRDPGNLGTILRTADAAGVQAVFLPPGAVDPYAPKVVRAAMGAHFQLPIISLSWKAIRGHLAPSGGEPAVQVYLSAANEGLLYTQADFRSPLALIVGSEAEGVSDVARDLAHDRIYIPMPGEPESLNVAVAAGILLFEIVRQRSLSAAS